MSSPNKKSDLRKMVPAAMGFGVAKKESKEKKAVAKGKSAAGGVAKTQKSALTKKRASRDGDEAVEGGGGEDADGEENVEKKLQELVAKKGPVKVAERYQKMTLLESILKRPDTYVGSLTREVESMFVYDPAAERMVHRKVSFVPGLYKIFDEIIVNAADHRQRDASMTTLKVEIDQKAGRISVYNNGSGVPVEMHETYGVYVPELIFGELLTGENYNDDEQRIVGGRNGYGAKLANIFSTEFVVETNDLVNNKYFKQVFSGNMKTKGKCEIKAAKGPSGWTKITFAPDLPKFGMTEFDDDTVAVFHKRVYDMAGSCPKGLKVFLNSKLLKVKGFEDYCRLFLPKDVSYAHSKTERWEVIVCGAPDGQFEQVSFVNSICTLKGGQHVSAVADQVAKGLVAHCLSKLKSTSVKPQMVKNHLWVFVNCLIVNPRFDSQTKINLTSARSQFGSAWKMTDEFLKKVIKSTEIVENVMDQARLKDQKGLKKTDGKKKGGRISGIAKLEDANDAGGRNAQQCTLIITEGDSAKALAMSGLTVVGRDRYGVFPLRGKLLNVRDAKVSQISANAEITNIKQILGLKSGATYEDTSSLRYGHLMIMADQDHDGSHIKGLVINLFAHFWPSLLKLPGFLTEFITPIVKVSRGKLSQSFFTIPEYELWKEVHGRAAGWKIKYYKGLGTSTPQEAKEYFSDVDRHKIDFAYTDPVDEKFIHLAFSKKAAEQRKEWIAQFVPGTFLDQNVDAVSYSDFINRELILFSIASNVRAIPSMVDGFKPGHRKIIYSCFKRNLTKEIKVAQLAGYVSEHSSYHHAEASLSGTIVGLAQNFVGNNNVNLLYPAGQFGTRAEGGDDAASPRYIFTHLCPIARLIFHPTDDQLLRYLDDDGQSIEPEWYMPVLPMALVNGADGIGTGYSTKIPNYNPRDIVANLKRMAQGEPPRPMHPWYKGFKGEITRDEKKKAYVVKGIITKEDDTTLRITELPLKKWTTSYRADTLEALLAEGFILGFKEHHTDATIDFKVKLTPENMRAAEAAGLLKKFGLVSSLSTANMVLFDHEGKLKKYASPLGVLADFYPLRLDFYGRRKKWMEGRLESELNRISNKLRFILAVVDDGLKIRNVKKHLIIEQLSAQKYDRLPKTAAHAAKTAATEDDALDDDSDGPKEGKESNAPDSRDAEMESNALGETESKSGVAAPKDGPDARGTKKNFDYLLSMPLWSLTMERVEALRKEENEKTAELAALRKTSEHAMWAADLDAFLVGLDEHEERERLELELGKKLKPKKKAVGERKKRADPKEIAKPSAKPSVKPSAKASVNPKSSGHVATDAASAIKKESAASAIKKESAASAIKKESAASAIKKESAASAIKKESAAHGNPAPSMNFFQMLEAKEAKKAEEKKSRILKIKEELKTASAKKNLVVAVARPNPKPGVANVKQEPKPSMPPKPATAQGDADVADPAVTDESPDTSVRSDAKGGAKRKPDAIDEPASPTAFKKPKLETPSKMETLRVLQLNTQSVSKMETLRVSQLNTQSVSKMETHRVSQLNTQSVSKMDTPVRRESDMPRVPKPE